MKSGGVSRQSVSWVGRAVSWVGWVRQLGGLMVGLNSFYGFPYHY